MIVLTYHSASSRYNIEIPFIFMSEASGWPLSREDQLLSMIEKDERDYFQKQDRRNAIANKLTLTFEWKAQYSDDYHQGF